MPNPLVSALRPYRFAAVLAAALWLHSPHSAVGADASSAVPPAKQKPKSDAKAAGQGLGIAKDVSKLKYKTVEGVAYGGLGAAEGIGGKRTLIRDAGKVGTVGRVTGRVLGGAKVRVECADGTEACKDAALDLAASEAKSAAIKYGAKRALGAVAGSAAAAAYACGEIIGEGINYVLKECTGKSGPEWSEDILVDAWGRLQYGDPDENTSPQAIQRHGEKLRFQHALQAGEPWALERQQQAREEMAEQAREIERNLRNPLTMFEKPFQKAREMFDLPTLPRDEEHKPEERLHNLFDEPEESTEPARKPGGALDLSGGRELGRERRQGAQTRTVSAAQTRASAATGAAAATTSQAISPLTIPLLDCRTLSADRETTQYCDHLMNNLERDLGSKPGVRFERRSLDYFAKPPDLR